MELIECFARGVKALGLTEGAAKADIKYTKKGPEIGEIAARLSGGYMSGWTFPYSSDFFLTKEALKIALGMEPDQLIKGRISLPHGDAFKTDSSFTASKAPVQSEASDPLDSPDISSASVPSDSPEPLDPSDASLYPLYPAWAAR